MAALHAQLARIAKLIERPTEPPYAAPPRPRGDSGVAPASQLVEPSPAKLPQAVVWLRATLAHGPMRASEVYAGAALASIARRTLERAKRRLRVRSEVDRRAIPKRWRWHLPERGADE